MSWFKKIFGQVNVLRPIVRNDFEKMLLGRLERYKVFCENEGKTFYTDNNNKIFKLKVLGQYQYYDVDGTVSGKVAETENGEIINVAWLSLYDKKPHDWVIYLSKSEKYQYSIRQRYDTDEELVRKFLNNLPKDVIRICKRCYKKQKAMYSPFSLVKIADWRNDELSKDELRDKKLKELGI